jgi:hypothetical protein
MGLGAEGIARGELERLYVAEGRSLSEIAAVYGCSLTTIWRKCRAAGIEIRPDGSSPRYPRHDFSGDLAEMAYLIGFRIGDLHVAMEGTRTIVVKCTSTRDEQVDLFRQLFERYGHVYTDAAGIAGRKRQSIGMEARLNLTFEFLLPKQDAVPEWILTSDPAFFAFLAGYVDAEGYFHTYYQRHYPKPLACLELRSYDRTLLTQLGQGLNARGIECPPARLRVRAGYVNSYGVRSNRDLWGLGVHRAKALLRLFEALQNHVRHAKRRSDMLRAWRAINSEP